MRRMGKAATAIRRAAAAGAGALFTIGLAAGGDPVPASDWRFYGGDPGGRRFSTIGDIDRGNVGRLRRAWTYHTGDLETRPSVQPAAFETTPLAVPSAQAA